MLLGEILSEDLIVPGLKAKDRWEAIEELLDLLVAQGKIAAENRPAIEAVVRKRESSMSTGIGAGIGIPHAATELIGNATGAFGRSTGGVDFDALDNEPVNMVMLFLVPQGQFQKHLHTLKDIATIFRDKDFRANLESAKDANEIWGIIKNFSSPND